MEVDTEVYVLCAYTVYLNPNFTGEDIPYTVHKRQRQRKQQYHRIKDKGKNNSKEQQHIAIALSISYSIDEKSDSRREITTKPDRSLITASHLQMK